MRTPRPNPATYLRSNRNYGTCQPCGGKVIHLTRKAARRAARETPAGGRCRAYPCPSNPEHWHIGHLPDAVRSGQIDRDRYRDHLR